MLYGLSTAPAAWSKVMMDLFGDNDHVLIYLDDVLIISNSFEEHLADLKWFLEKCSENGITLSQSKIHLCQSELTFLGQQITSEGIRPTKSHIDALNNFPVPSDRNALKRFIGMAQFNGRLVKNSSTTLAPLHKLCSNKTQFLWQSKHQEAFIKMKEDLEKSDGLYHRNLDLPIF